MIDVNRYGAQQPQAELRHLGYHHSPLQLWMDVWVEVKFRSESVLQLLAFCI